MDRVTREHRDRLLAEVARRPVARLELAELYRRLGHVDQAGRWGITTEGWTTMREQDAYAAMLASIPAADLAASLRHLSGVGRLAPLGGDALAVLAQAEPRHRRVHSAPTERTMVSRLSWAFGLLTAAGLTIAVGTILIVLWAVGFGGSDARAILRWGAAIALTLLALAGVLRLPVVLARRERGEALAFAIVGPVVLGALAVWAWTSVSLGAALMPWTASPL